VMTNEAPTQAAEGDSRDAFEGINLDSRDLGQQPHQDTDDCTYARGATRYLEPAGGPHLKPHQQRGPVIL
jgi:hypothetical protein